MLSAECPPEVLYVKPGSVADKAGLQKGDILLMMDGISLSNRIHESLVTYIAEHTKLEMRVLRDDSRCDTYLPSSKVKYI